ncbi:hypothetical protein SAMN02910317_01969 [Ruminococcaceae bacterium FB2012]|nr:hypothetical protein SAMN02910317_01969 [Ruminococcaceae bacterium FB2012]
MSIHFIDMEIYDQAVQAAQGRIYTYRVRLGDLLWGIKSSPASEDQFFTGLISQMQSECLVRKSYPGSRESVTAAAVAASCDKDTISSFCLPKDEINVLKLIEVVTGVKGFRSKSHPEQNELAKDFIIFFITHGIDIAYLIKLLGSFRPTDEQLLREYLLIAGDPKYIVSVTDINRLRKKLKAGSKRKELELMFNRRISPDRSVISQSGITPDEVGELMDKFDKSTRAVAEELSKRTIRPITYQQVISYCHRHGIPLGHYNPGDEYLDVVIIGYETEWPNAKIRCRCRYCGAEKVYYQSDMNKHKREGKPLCRCGHP